VINDPRAVLQTDRQSMMDRLAALPNVLAPRTRRLRRDEISAARLKELSLKIDMPPKPRITGG